MATVAFADKTVLPTAPGALASRDSGIGHVTSCLPYLQVWVDRARPLGSGWLAGSGGRDHTQCSTVGRPAQLLLVSKAPPLRDTDLTRSFQEIPLRSPPARVQKKRGGSARRRRPPLCSASALRRFSAPLHSARVARPRHRSSSPLGRDEHVLLRSVPLRCLVLLDGLEVRWCFRHSSEARR